MLLKEKKKQNQQPTNRTVVDRTLITQLVAKTRRLTLKATGSVLLQRQWEGSTEHRKLGLSVRTSSAGWSAMISAMLRFSCGRSLGTTAAAAAAAVSGCPVGELTSFIFPGTGWRLLDGGLNLRVALGSTGMRITTTAWGLPTDGGNRSSTGGHKSRC